VVTSHESLYLLLGKLRLVQRIIMDVTTRFI
jgi:hypothetical protein